MREDIRNWWEQARHDLIVAKFNLGGGHYDVAAFYCHQVVERGLKALCILKKQGITWRDAFSDLLGKKLRPS